MSSTFFRFFSSAFRRVLKDRFRAASASALFPPDHPHDVPARPHAPRVAGLFLLKTRIFSPWRSPPVRARCSLPAKEYRIRPAQTVNRAQQKVHGQIRPLHATLPGTRGLHGRISALAVSISGIFHAGYAKEPQSPALRKLRLRECHGAPTAHAQPRTPSRTAPVHSSAPSAASFPAC